MTVVCATSEDLASVHRKIAALADEVGKVTQVVRAVNVDYGEAINSLKTRVNELSDRLASDPIIRPCAVVVRSRDEEVPWQYVVDLDSVIADGLSSFIRARNKGWGEVIPPEEAIRRMIREGLRSTQRGRFG